MPTAINTLVFGNYTLDRQQCILLCEGKHVSLTPKAFEILLLLIENRERIVSKDELMAQVWPDAVVEEINIAKNISLLRKILAQHSPESDADRTEGDNNQTDSNRYIVTIPKRGYRFVHEVEEITSKPPTDPPPVFSAPAPEPARQPEPKLPEATGNWSAFKENLFPFSGRHYVTGIVATSLAITMVWLAVFKKPESFDLTKLRINKVNSWRGSAGADLLRVRTSPDSHLIAFSKSEAGPAEIYIQQLAGGSPIAITSDEWPDYSPVWSPDGQKIAYLSRRSDGNELWVIPSFGGKGDRITSFNGDYRELLGWSKDGTRIFYNTSAELFALDLKSGQTTRLTNFGNANSNRYHFSLSPDESSVAYAESADKSSRIFTAALDGSSRTQITNDGEQNFSPVWFADNQRILYGSKRGDTVQLCVAYLDKRKPVQLTASHESAFPFLVTPDGRRILYAISREEADVYRLDLETGAETPLTSDISLKVWPEVSPDGKTVAIQRTEHEFNILHSALLTKPVAANSAATELIADGFDFRWSPRAGRLAFLRAEGITYNLWTARSDGADQKQLTRNGVVPNGFGSRPYNWAQPYNYSWSPDGNKLAFCTQKSSTFNVWVIGSDGGEEMISNNHDPALKLSCPIWSAGGNRLAYLSQSSLSTRSPRSIEMYEGGNVQTIFQTESRIRMIGWSGDGTHFFAGLVEPEEQGLTVNLRLVQIPASGTPAMPVAQFPSVYFNSPKLSPDGKALIFVSRQNGCDNIWQASVVDGRLKMITANRDPHERFSGLAWLPDGKGICYSKQSSSTTIWAIENFD